jgi:O-acetyl-ADP-ribose deacetylase (regulator of RNase III)
VQSEFIGWVEEDKGRLALGNIFCSEIADNLAICNMVSQRGYGPSATPRISYEALRKCLDLLADEALKHNATVHMPRIGCGQAGGSWQVVQELIDEALCRRGIEVTVYDLPGASTPAREGDSAPR